MQTALDTFKVSMLRVRDMHALHHSLTIQLTSAVDLSDMLRAEIVLAVSAFDYFIHELTRLGMLECHTNARPRTDSFKRFPMRIEAALGLTNQVLDTEIRTKHGYQSFQHPDKVAEAIRLVSNVKLWDAVGIELGITTNNLKTNLSLVIDRRNKIAHEADLDPSYPGQLWSIDRLQVEYTVDLLEKIGGAVFKVIA